MASPTVQWSQFIGAPSQEAETFNYVEFGVWLPFLSLSVLTSKIDDFASGIQETQIKGLYYIARMLISG